jgi:hypothetical protein
MEKSLLAVGKNLGISRARALTVLDEKHGRDATISSHAVMLFARAANCMTKSMEKQRSQIQASSSAVI